jgi:hypothetical protein
MQVSSCDVPNFVPPLFQAGDGWPSQVASVLSRRTAHRDCLPEKRSRQSPLFPWSFSSWALPLHFCVARLLVVNLPLIGRKLAAIWLWF